MARPLRDLPLGSADDDETENDSKRLDRSAARAFSAALSSLLIATLVVTRSSDALEPDGTLSSSAIDVGTVELTDDDGGRSLFDASDLGPGQPLEECITITYDGTILPVEVTMAVRSTGDLARHLDVEVERGVGGGFDSCDGFEPEETIHVGTLATLTNRGEVEMGAVRNSGDESTYRFRFEVQDDAAAVGRSSTIDVVWEAVPS